MPNRLSGRVALVIGGASGIGLATVERLSAEGAAVYAADIAPKRGAGGAAKKTLAFDVTNEAAIKAGVASVIEAEDRVDILVNCAGIAAAAPLQETSTALWRQTLEVNLTGTFLTMREVLPLMYARGRGAIVNVGSDAGLVGMPDQAAYCASKGGVVHLTRAASLDAAPYGVRVNCVCPCFVDTPLMRDWVKAQPDPDAAQRAAAAMQPIGRIGAPEEIAASIAFLASDEASFVTGIALAVDGGVTAQ